MMSVPGLRAGASIRGQAPPVRVTAFRLRHAAEPDPGTVSAEGAGSGLTHAAMREWRGRCLTPRSPGGQFVAPTGARPSSRSSQARAVTHSRLTVAGETSSANAVSATLSPQK